MLPHTSDLAYPLLTERYQERSYNREDIMQDLVYTISLGAIPLLAVIACFVVTRIWGD